MKVILSLIILLFVITSCITENEEIHSGTGTVSFIELEGGFYGIMGDNQKNYDPTNLPSEFRVDGLKVSFKFKFSGEQTSFHMWGSIIDLVSISKIN